MSLCFFDDEPQLNEHEIAWAERDWDAVKALADQFKDKPENTLFKLLNSINYEKRDIDVSGIPDYPTFMINSMLSQHPDTIYTVYNANMLMTGLPDQAHFNYLSMLVPTGKRFSKSVKLTNSFKDTYIIRLIMEYYQVNSDMAYEYRKTLELKGHLDSFLTKAKAIATDSFLKTITKNPKELKELKML